MMDPRTPTFKAIKAARNGRSYSSDEVLDVHALLDRLGVPRESHRPPSAGQLHASAAAIALIKEFEGLQLRSYLCPAKVWTIGYGATGPGIGPGVEWTIEQAERRILADIAAVEEGVRFLIGSKRTSQGQFDALVSFAYNCGTDIDSDHTPEGLGDSTLLLKHLTGDYAGAAAEFGKWVNGGGRRLEGLVRRRKREAALYGQAA
ncbi:MAG: lysozyme [Pseudomonadota bacterium]|nr:lysozyme [Pseudomonadota bacterium]